MTSGSMADATYVSNEDNAFCVVDQVDDTTGEDPVDDHMTAEECYEADCNDYRGF